MTEPAGPPGDGRQNHFTMNDDPAGEPTPATPEPIPGAYESDTATHRQPGAIGGSFNGADTPSADPSSVMDEHLREEYRRDGGGGQHGR